MEKVDHAGELCGLDGAVGVCVVPVHNLHDLRPAEAFEEFCRRVCVAHLRRVEGVADINADLLREGS